MIWFGLSLTHCPAFLLNDTEMYIFTALKPVITPISGDSHISKNDVREEIYNVQSPSEESPVTISHHDGLLNLRQAVQRGTPEGVSPQAAGPGDVREENG